MIKPLHSLHTSRGFTMMSLLLWSIAVALVALLGMKIFPTVNEYLTIRKVVNNIAREATTVSEVRAAFEKHKQIEYAIVTISSQDLIITKENEKLVISFAYDKEIELMAPVYLLIKYQWRSK